MFLANSLRARSALEKMLEFLDARLAVKADTMGGMRAADWVASAGIRLGRDCSACRFTWGK